MNCFNHTRQSHDQDCVIRPIPDEELNKITETRCAFDSDEQPSDPEAMSSDDGIDHSSLDKERLGEIHRIIEESKSSDESSGSSESVSCGLSEDATADLSKF